MKAKVWVNRIIFVAALAVFIYAAIQLTMIYLDYRGGANEYKDLQEFTSGGTVMTADDNNEEHTAGDAFTVDFQELKKVNDDIIGWIRFENMDISYPVVQGEDNDYYLKHTFNQEQRAAGSIFAEYQNSRDFSDSNTFIYGHNMKDGTMFAKLNKLQEKGVFQENQRFWIYTPEYTYQYDIFSCYVTSVNADIFNSTFTDEQGYRKWIDQAVGSSSYDTGVKPDTNDKIVTLMTCTPAGGNYRMLVHAVRSSTEAVK
jgi:sortase B